MSSDSLAVFRKGLGPDLNALAEKHMQHDLTQSDRDALRSAASTVSLHTGIGSLVGLTLASLLAFRLRSARRRMFTAFRAAEKPQAVRFADGREETLPDLTAVVKPSRLGDFATYTLLGAGGIFFGGETGLLTGTLRARQQIAQDRESGQRIQNAFKKFQADALREQAAAIEGSITKQGSWSI
ncbi:hypothetical protein DOTSEDRAFT_67487 [Dothistroma septosporum NZE10]|uniref:Altered inheritance of mitochondria protein 11 n=1 Tax=Dothistroma septosporum (strain NZE10 / CBS 128990) TaxID=675120 RepID=N1Q1T7_DOTSN|nr:hypothetical protein DOTSEDRAFT_67487 [Dothistroma septosporum NZE10]